MSAQTNYRDAPTMEEFDQLCRLIDLLFKKPAKREDEMIQGNSPFVSAARMIPSRVEAKLETDERGVVMCPEETVKEWLNGGGKFMTLRRDERDFADGIKEVTLWAVDEKRQLWRVFMTESPEGKLVESAHVMVKSSLNKGNVLRLTSEIRYLAERSLKAKYDEIGVLLEIITLV